MINYFSKRTFWIRSQSPLAYLIHPDSVLNPYADKIRNELIHNAQVKELPQWNKIPIPKWLKFSGSDIREPLLNKNFYGMVLWLISIVILNILPEYEIYSVLELMFITITLYMPLFLLPNTYWRANNSYYQISFQSFYIPPLFKILYTSTENHYFKILDNYGMSYEQFMHRILTDEKYTKILWEFIQAKDGNGNMMIPFYPYLSEIAEKVIPDIQNVSSKREKIEMFLKNLSFAFPQETEQEHPIFQQTRHYLNSLNDEETILFYSKLIPCYLQQVSNRDFGKLQSDLHQIISHKKLNYEQ